MTRDEILRMAREAGMTIEDGGWCVVYAIDGRTPIAELPTLIRFAQLVARERQSEPFAWASVWPSGNIHKVRATRRMAESDIASWNARNPTLDQLDLAPLYR